MNYTENILRAPDSELVCWCADVSKGEIRQQIAAGAQTLEDIRRTTAACMQGDCRKNNPRGR